MRCPHIICNIIACLPLLGGALNPATAQPNPLVADDALRQQRWVDSLMRTLTLRERIGQLFMVAAYSNRAEAHVRGIQELVEADGIGGLIFFQGGPVRQAHLTNRYQARAKVPLLIAMDAEWGLGMRLDSTFGYPRQMLMGAQADTALVYAIGADIAQHMRRLGVHVNFAPVVDVNSNPQNPVINTRSFGDNLAHVTRMGVAYMAGLQDNGVMAVAKHYPGHGDTSVDSHLDMPRLDHDSARLAALELVPFAELIARGVQGVMVSHLSVPALDPEASLPSTLSERMVSGLLQGQMGFGGLVFTDAMNMRGITKYFSNVEANVRALQAGNDVLEFALDVRKSIDRIERMVKKGDMDEQLINDKCRKVLMAKYKAGLSQYAPVRTEGLYADLNTPRSAALRRQLIANGLVLLSNRNDLLPLRRLDTLSLAYVEVGQGRGDGFAQSLSLYAPVARYGIAPSGQGADFDSLLNLLEPHNLVIVGAHCINNSIKGNYGVTEGLSNFLFDLSFRKPVVLDVFGTPYALAHLRYPQELAAIVVSFDNSADVQDLSAQLIFGGRGASGRMPVAVGGGFAHGDGQRTGQTRLAYAMPEEMGISSARLADIDSIAWAAIDTGATPGMQVLAAKDGIVFYHRCFGSPTYTADAPVDMHMLYDVASVTKVTATLPVVMHLYNSGRLPLTSTLGDYLGLADYPDKARIPLRDLLLHRAGLTAWIPFHQSTLATLTPGVPLYSSAQSDDYPFVLSKNRYMHKHIGPSPAYYSIERSMGFPTRVAERLHVVEGMVDTVLHRMNTSAIKGQGAYKYSDLSFMYLQRVVENMEQKSLNVLADSLFYRPLGMWRTTFNPLSRFDRRQIAPTENDLTFRHQLLWGDVHDQGAALLGGVSGHAGLFSTANDMAKMLQMWLWGGQYGGQCLLADTTVALFTTKPADTGGNRRALGFDRPNMGGKSTPCGTLASACSYGHLGFTGTIVWADPQHGLAYVLLANRIHPDAANSLLMQLNVRTKIHDALYRAIGVSSSGP